MYKVMSISDKFKVDDAHWIENNQRVSVKHDPKGKGRYVVSNQSFKEGELVIASSIRMITGRDKFSIQHSVTNKRFDALTILVSHACKTPNLEFRETECGGYSLHATRDIEAGEELEWNYNSTEPSIGDFTCFCLCGQIMDQDKNAIPHHVRGYLNPDKNHPDSLRFSEHLDRQRNRVDIFLKLRYLNTALGIDFLKGALEQFSEVGVQNILVSMDKFPNPNQVIATDASIVTSTEMILPTGFELKAS